jgi:hypothetical protein
MLTSPVPSSPLSIACETQILVLTHSSHTTHTTLAVKMKSAMMAFVEGQLTSDYALVKETKELRTVLQYQMGNEAARNSLFIAVHIQPAPLRRRPSA